MEQWMGWMRCMDKYRFYACTHKIYIYTCLYLYMANESLCIGLHMSLPMIYTTYTIILYIILIENMILSVINTSNEHVYLSIVEYKVILHYVCVCLCWFV